MIQVAMADDHAMIRGGISALISGIPGYEVSITASNGQDLLQQLRAAETLPQVCVLDINMPVLNGYQTLEILNREFPDIHVLVLSMYDNEASIIKMINGGAKGYILKDSDPQFFEEALMTVSRGYYYHSELVTQKLVSAVNDTRAVLPVITQKELRFLELCCTEMTYKEMAELLGNSSRTVEGYRDALFSKLNLKTRTGLAIYALKMGLVSMK